jgi:probable rRNA maturation factor
LKTRRKSQRKPEKAAIRITNRQQLLKLDPVRLRRDARNILKLLGAGQRELSLLFVDDEEIREINRNYLQKDRPTNVISFSLSEGEFGTVNEELLGDVVVSVETAGREAQAAGIPAGDAVLNLMIHGILHLTNYDHEGPHAKARARIMSVVQESVFFEIRGYRLEVTL